MKGQDEEYYYFKIKREDYDKTLPSIFESIHPKIFEKIEGKLSSIFECYKPLHLDEMMNRITRMGEIEATAMERIQYHGKKDIRAIIPNKLEKGKTLHDVVGYMVIRLLVFIDENKITHKDRKVICREAYRLMLEFMEQNLSKKFIASYPPNRMFIIIGHIVLSFGLFKNATEFMKNEEAANFVASCLK